MPSLLSIAFFLCNFAYASILTKFLTIWFYVKFFIHEPVSKAHKFPFRFASKCVEPIIFFITSSVPILISIFFGFEILKDINQMELVSILSLFFKISLLWLVYRIADLSSINKTINKMVVLILFLTSLFNFLGLSEYIIQFVDSFKENFGNIESSAYKGILFMILFGIIFWFCKIFLEILQKLLDLVSMKANTKVIVVKFFSMVLIFSAILVSLVSAGVDIKHLTMIGSALVVGLGFGFQKIVSNVISGIAISLEETIKEGDIIIVHDQREIQGIVKSLNMRYILLAEFDGKEVIIPNDTIITSSVSNLTHSHTFFRLRVDIILPIDINLKVFRTDILKIMQSNPYASSAEESLFHISGVSDTGISCFLFFWIDSPFDLNISRTSLMFEILNYLKENKIHLPAPNTKIELARRNSKEVPSAN